MPVYNVHRLNALQTTDHEYALLESIYHHEDTRPVKQRDLARIVGISLGMTNVILRKLAQKGWVVVRKISARNIQYAVTPAGIDEISRRSYQFFKRTVLNVVYYKDALERFLLSAKAKNFHAIVLVGKSDFDFVLAFLCQKHKLEFTQSETSAPDEGVLMAFAEDYTPPGNGAAGHPDGVYLHDILIGH
jgi:DNA-binding MarR family transcriptional regulator